MFKLFSSSYRICSLTVVPYERIILYMMNVTVESGMEQAQIESGISMARDWLIATSKYAGLQGKIVFDVTNGVSNIQRVGCENYKRCDKFQAMVRRAVKGFRDSPDWTIVRDEYDRWVFVSSDKKWRVFIQDTYNGSGGWKVATKTLGIQIKYSPEV